MRQKIKKVRVGINMANAYTFASNFPGWHSFDTRCRATVHAIKRLARIGLVEVNKYNQFRIP